LSTTVESNKAYHLTEMEQFENRFTSKLQTTCEEQQKQLIEISQTYIQNIQNEQKSNNNLLRTMLAAQENSIEQKLPDNFRQILSKLNPNDTSPTRKKAALNNSTEQDTNARNGDDYYMPDIDENRTTIVTKTITNPFYKSTQPSRSVHITLPTTTP
jgi:hypothetical protein